MLHKPFRTFFDSERTHIMSLKAPPSLLFLLQTEKLKTKDFELENKKKSAIGLWYFNHDQVSSNQLATLVAELS